MVSEALKTFWNHNFFHFCGRLATGFYFVSIFVLILEPHHEKTWFLHMGKQKPQISCEVTAQLISAFVFSTQLAQLLYFINLKFHASIAIFCGCTALFMSHLVGNLKDKFCRDSAHLIDLI